MHTTAQVTLVRQLIHSYLEIQLLKENLTYYFIL